MWTELQLINTLILYNHRERIWKCKSWKCISKYWLLQEIMKKKKLVFGSVFQHCFDKKWLVINQQEPVIKHFNNGIRSVWIQWLVEISRYWKCWWMKNNIGLYQQSRVRFVTISPQGQSDLVSNGLSPPLRNYGKSPDQAKAESWWFRRGCDILLAWSAEDELRMCAGLMLGWKKDAPRCSKTWC